MAPHRKRKELESDLVLESRCQDIRALAPSVQVKTLEKPHERTFASASFWDFIVLVAIGGDGRWTEIVCKGGVVTRRRYLVCVVMVMLHTDKHISIWGLMCAQGLLSHGTAAPRCHWSLPREICQLVWDNQEVSHGRSIFYLHDEDRNKVFPAQHRQTSHFSSEQVMTRDSNPAYWESLVVV